MSVKRSKNKFNLYFWTAAMVVSVWFFMAATGVQASATASQEHGKDSGEILSVYGKITNTHDTGVGDVTIDVFFNNKPLELLSQNGHGHGNEGIITEGDGSFQGKFSLPADSIDKATIEINVYKPSYAKKNVKLSSNQLLKRDGIATINADIVIERSTGPAFWIATVIFILAYILISFELLHRTLAAMLGAATILVISYTLGTFNPEFHIQIGRAHV